MSTPERSGSPAPGFFGPVSIGRRADYIRRHRQGVSLLVLAVSLGTCAIFAAAAGWPTVTQALHHLSWWLIPITLVAHVAAYGGYLIAHHQVVNRSAVAVGWRRGAQLMVIGFGAWLPGGGFSVDRRALTAAGLERADADLSAIMLGLLELLVLTPVAWFCALLLLGHRSISASYTVPWIAAVPVGFLLALAAAPFATVPAGAGWARRAVGQLGAGTRACLALLAAPRRGGFAVAGIAAYWAADVVAFWAALAFLGVHIGTDRLILAYATGYVFTRRTLPFAGAAVVEALLTVSLVAAGVPLASAAIAVFVYRLSDFGLTIFAALGASSVVERTLTFSVDDPASPGRPALNAGPE